tara:strand:- start:3750 stop:3938 length:189 start_codon:yes stop_codon:yes gene_type:complete
MNLLILIASLLAIAFFIMNLVKAKRDGRLTSYLRDLLVIFLGFIMTLGIVLIAVKVLPRVFM